MFLEKRKAQQESAKRMTALENKKKEKEMLKIVLHKLFETLSNSLQDFAKISTDSNKLRIDKETIKG